MSPDNARDDQVAGEPMNLRQFDLNLLVGLQAILRCRNVSQAAQQVGLSQSAMSDELRRLRHMFADQLLVRVGREYRLTRLAEDLVEPINEVLRSLQLTITRRAEFDPGAQSRRFCLAMSDYTTLVLLQPLMRRLKNEAPGIRLHVRSIGAEYGRLPLQEEVDLLIAPPAELKGLRSEPLFTDHWVCIVDRHHPEIGERLSARAFGRLAHVAVSPLGSRDSYEPPMSVPRRVEIATSNWALVPFLVSESCLVAVVQERLARRLAGAAHIKLLELPFAMPALTLAMYWNPVAESDPANTWFRALVRDVAQAL